MIYWQIWVIHKGVLRQIIYIRNMEFFFFFFLKALWHDFLLYWEGAACLISTSLPLHLLHPSITSPETGSLQFNSICHKIFLRSCNQAPGSLSTSYFLPSSFPQRSQGSTTTFNHLHFQNYPVKKVGIFLWTWLIVMVCALKYCG